MSFSSVSSAILNAGSKSAFWKYDLMIFKQKLSMVEMVALPRSLCCLRYSGFKGSLSISFPSSSEILFRIWAAAALVNVMITSLSISTGFSLSVIIFMILATRTAVFPDPAAAETRIFLPVVFITFSCASVHFLPIYILRCY